MPQSDPTPEEVEVVALAMQRPLAEVWDGCIAPDWLNTDNCDDTQCWCMDRFREMAGLAIKAYLAHRETTDG